MRDFWEIASYVVTALGLPVAILFFAWEQRKERDNEEEEQYQLLSDAYIDFLKVVIANPDLSLYSQPTAHRWTDEQRERALHHAGPALLQPGEGLPPRRHRVPVERRRQRAA